MNLMQMQIRKRMQPKLMKIMLIPSKYLKFKVIQTAAVIVMNSVKID